VWIRNTVPQPCDTPVQDGQEGAVFVRARASHSVLGNGAWNCARARLCVSSVWGTEGGQRSPPPRRRRRSCQPAWRWLGAVASRNTFSWPAVHGPILSPEPAPSCEVGFEGPTEGGLLCSATEKLGFSSPSILLELFQKWMIHGRLWRPRATTEQALPARTLRAWPDILPCVGLHRDRPFVQCQLARRYLTTAFISIRR
jgi:hypothetical protein